MSSIWKGNNSQWKAGPTPNGKRDQASLRLQNEPGDVCISFLLGKDRVAPSKLVTTPRLEPTGTVLSVWVDKMVKEELQLQLDESCFWTDNTTVLKYINNENKRFWTFDLWPREYVPLGSIEHSTAFCEAKANLWTLLSNSPQVLIEKETKFDSRRVWSKWPVCKKKRETYSTFWINSGKDGFREYLASLQERQRWRHYIDRRHQSPLNSCIIRKVIKTFPDKSGMVRSV